MKKIVSLIVITVMMISTAACSEMSQQEVSNLRRMALEDEEVMALVQQNATEEELVALFGDGAEQGGHPKEGLFGRRPPKGNQFGMRPPLDGENHDMPEMESSMTGGQIGQGGPGTTISVAEANDIEADLVTVPDTSDFQGTYRINDTGTTTYYGNSTTIAAPSVGHEFYGQDASYTTNVMTFTDNGDGTVTDNNTGLMWQQDPGEKMTWVEAAAMVEDFQLAGYEDWRLPTIKELYSLMDFTGNTIDTPYIDRDYFVFKWGDETGERQIDSQYATSTIYDAPTMGNNATMFGVNFADGRIKGYPTSKEFYVMLVRDNEAYGYNNFADNGDGTITDLSTGLMWMTYDSGDLLGEDGAMVWDEALAWSEDLDYAGYDDWKLPDAKELQSIVDYTRSPDTTDSAAIDPMFSATEMINIAGESDYGFYWTSTTHAENDHGDRAVYVCFGRGMGEMHDSLMDVHGAGCQRSDPKTGDEDDFPSSGKGPQGDVQSVFNYVRAVRLVD